MHVVANPKALKKAAASINEVNYTPSKMRANRPWAYLEMDYTINPVALQLSVI